ncbi:hypothetical protein H5T51_06150 [Candidatus Bathyarchaeota archaeon]|nr:hypothetical protein [Candidatus Bathyarchaeota archaeon]
MASIKKWIESRKPMDEKRYEEEKMEFEKAVGKPFITIKLEIPEGCEKKRTEFLSLETDETFLQEVKELVKKRLKSEKCRKETKREQ